MILIGGAVDQVGGHSTDPSGTGIREENPALPLRSMEPREM